MVEIVAVDRVALVARQERRFHALLAPAVEVAVGMAVTALVLFPELAQSRESIGALGALSLASALVGARLLAELAREVERLWLGTTAAGAAHPGSWLLPIELYWFLVPADRREALENLGRERAEAGARMLSEERGCWAYLALLVRLNAQAVELLPRTMVLSAVALVTALLGALRFR